eukprot:CAMPEP_0113915782 /NCGR_PEP_ID=MMETSP0780_2-20120614/31531_1 /TAXON_ID=652834 /ORGANISM="Palpitomonas bilix" /LENGTH=71 /DNA_ID=CAMNT_0000914605 /DNA_START=234 /DNA_END=446 /DNA_ORIENTATION=- /assembly_acc=CAM_ASM_000599
MITGSNDNTATVWKKEQRKDRSETTQVAGRCVPKRETFSQSPETTPREWGEAIKVRSRGGNKEGAPLCVEG